jgi:hypothetical protein
MSISRRIVTAGVAGVLAAGLVGAGLAWAGSAGGGGGGTVVPAAASDPAPASGYMPAPDDFGGVQGFDRSIAQDDGTTGHHCDHDGSGGSGSGGSGSSSQGSSGAQSDSGASTSAGTQPTSLGT